MSSKSEVALVIEHAMLVARHASGDDLVVERLGEIEAALGLDAYAIAAKAVEIYLDDYRS